MKTSVLLLFIIGISNLLFAQTPNLVETQDWLKQKIELYGNIIYENNSSNKNNIRTYSFDFSEPGMLNIFSTMYWYYSNTYDISYYSIPIKYMNSVQYKYEENYIIALFKLSSDYVSIAEIKEYKSNKIVNGEMQFELIKKDSNLVGISVLLDPIFKEDDMQSRFKAAIDHLIILNGGHVTKEVF
jgi:hypothetical protein